MLEFGVLVGTDMSRDFSGWGVSTMGALLALVGGYWLFAGWEHIQIERGWSQFIAGATALSGGVVTMAIGRLIRALVLQSAAIPPAQSIGREAVKTTSPRKAGSAPEPPRRARSNEQIKASPTASEPVNFDESTAQEAQSSEWLETAQSPAASSARLPSVPDTETFPEADVWRNPDPHYPGGDEPSEVDRYTAGDSTYVMYADGSVEVRTPDGVQVYESLDSLRASREER